MRQNTGDFIERLLIFCLFLTVRNNPAARPAIDFTLFSQQSADGDIAVHRATAADVSNTAAITVAALGFEFFDNFHRADFWRTGDRAAWKTGTRQGAGMAVSR